MDFFNGPCVRATIYQTTLLFLHLKLIQEKIIKLLICSITPSWHFNLKFHINIDTYTNKTLILYKYILSFSKIHGTIMSIFRNFMRNKITRELN